MTDKTQRVVFHLSLRDDSDVAAARRKARELAYEQGLSSSAAEALATAVSEIARNAVIHATGGRLLFALLAEPQRVGVIALTRDDGPGISNIEDAMRDGFSTASGLGLGLPGARRMVDEFELTSVLGKGTTVTLKKWRAR
jgi:serine/threonine-protein kinase RsbT